MLKCQASLITTRCIKTKSKNIQVVTPINFYVIKMLSVYKEKKKGQDF